MVNLSIVIPVYNEQQNVPLLYEEIKQVLKNHKNIQYEIIFVDDGSTDQTFAEIYKITKKDKEVRGIQFQKNSKKSAAYMAGFAYCKGKYIITMDGDLQDDPIEIPRFFEALKKYDVVIGWKFRRRDSIFKKIPSKIFNYMNYLFFNVRLHDNDCGYKGLKTSIAQELQLYGDLYRYIPALVKQQGYRIGELKVRHRKRRFGKSKYGLKRLLTGALDLLTVKFIIDFNQRPLHLFGGTGVLSFTIGFIAELYVLYAKYIIGHSFTSHLPMLILGVLLIILGVQLIGIGLIGELIVAQRYKERYKIRQVIGKK